MMCLFLTELGVYCPHLVGVCLLNLFVTYTYLLSSNLWLILVVAQDSPKVTLELWKFLEKIFRIPLKERTWKQLVTLDTIDQYCEGPEPTDIARCYDKIANKRESIIYYLFFTSLNNSCLTLSPVSFGVEMDDGRRRAFIRKQVTEHAKKRLEGVISPTGDTAQAKPFIKRKLTDKGDHPVKKLKEVVVTTVGEMPAATQEPLPLCHGVGKGLMSAKGPVLEQHAPLFCEDLRYAVGFLSSIIKDNNYEDLGNHATKAIGESGLFGLAQVHNCPPSLLFFNYYSYF